MEIGEVWQRSGVELLRDLASLEERMRRDHAASLELIAELHSRDVIAEVGYPDVPTLLRDALRISLQEARQRLEHASAVSANGTPPPTPTTLHTPTTQPTSTAPADWTPRRRAGSRATPESSRSCSAVAPNHSTWAAPPIA